MADTGWYLGWIVAECEYNENQLAMARCCCLRRSHLFPSDPAPGFVWNIICHDAALMDYIVHLAVFVGIYIILAVACDLLAGHAGFLSIAHAAFCGIGAYTSAVLCSWLGVSFVGSLVAGMVTASAFSMLIAIPSLRLSDDFFVVATFAFQVIVFNIFNNLIGVTRGPMGIPGIPQPVILGWHVTSRRVFESMTSGAESLRYKGGGHCWVMVRFG